jgi:hypothetical protein
MTFSSPELVAARMSERREQAAAGRLAAAFRAARDCCTTATSPFRSLARSVLRRRPATSC